MTKNKIIKFAIIGTGMVGTAIGYSLKKAGHTIIAISDKSPTHLKRANSYLSGKSYRNPRQAAHLADCILITTSDDMILCLCEEIAIDSSIKGKSVFHMSGAGGLDLLDPAKKAGASVACIHPLQSFSSIDSAIRNIPGSYFGITTDNKTKTLAKKIVHDLGGIPLVISSKQKPLYHLAACLASNYFVSLMNVVEYLYVSIGISEADAKKAYLPLVKGTLKNIEQNGTIMALTGPIARGDCSTIQKHIDAINTNAPQYAFLYKTLGLITVDIAKRKGSLKSIQAKKIIDVLEGDKHYEYTK